MLPHILNPHHRSLLRGSVLVLGSLAAAFLISGFPDDRSTPFLVLPVLTALLGTADTIRCIRPRWDLYHGGILFCIYMDLMAVCMILFLLLYPFLSSLGSVRGIL
jgi:hypothetical protein